ncbi:DNA-directed RNA polymerase subunit alpha C-terminal domain-containing protein [Candidatus Frankia nodulisporulans]|uniref:DNA-directed RNA polymerase subunit alpha C-terminal domain-containing protein n=1 Tax=Candidatus Frankia nodulisporulans TaxID=2060052 RepID=UPI0013D2F365|nr:DNA-directed RNA polymerase subunit alpha C-terminal domain-containing protein [Candidatus Frankia nodulisporulans]
MGQETVRTAPRLVHVTGTASGYAGKSAHEALTVVTPQFIGGRERSSTVREQYADRAGLEVTLYGLAESREIHVIGQNRLADQMRDLLRGNQIPAWRLHELPRKQTPVHALYALLSVRSANLLRLVPFLSVEEVAAVPDEALLELRGLGQGSLTEIRSALTDPSLREYTGVLTPSWPDPSGERPEHDGGDDIAARLRPEHRLRYRDFLRGLAAAGLSAAALDTILDSISAEPVPPGDPIVEDLLQIANATDLLTYYTDTHEPAALDASGAPMRPSFLDR